MAIPTLTSPAGVNAGGPATSFVSLNTRVRSQTGFLAIQSDLVLFAAPMVSGAWTTAATRVFVQGVPVVLQSSIGTAVSVNGATSPMTVVFGDPRVRAS